MIAALPRVHPEVPGLLRRLLQQFRSGDDAALAAALDAVPASLLEAAHTVVGALALGGADFAARLVGHGRAELDLAARYEIVLNAFLPLLEVPEGAPADHETQVARWLIDSFGLQVREAALIDTIRAEFLITAGPLEEVPQAVESALRHQQWTTALAGLVRCRQALNPTPRSIFGMAAMCLHKLGRYEEAEQWVAQGLGERSALMVIGPVHTEAELMRRWGAHAKPVVSIICTTYNHERYIESAIRGFLSQTCSFPFEILIHDDASIDGTQRVIRHWQQQYPNVIKTVLQTQNQLSRGVRPFELLLAQARGDFVATCEGDDFWIDPSKLQVQVGFLQSHPEFSCSAHNYYHFMESALTVKQWFPPRKEFVLSRGQLMGVLTLLWFPTLVFRKTFSVMPPERNLSPIGDQFLTSYLGTQGMCMYFANTFGAVRRENEFSMWSPLSNLDKEKLRIKTWSALVRLHERLGNEQAVADLMAKIAASPLDEQLRRTILDEARLPTQGVEPMAA